MRSMKLLSVGAASALFLCGCERWALDRQMEELCKRDGGVKVYEKVVLPASEFSNLGRPLFRHQRISQSTADQLGPNYRFVEDRKFIAGSDATPEKGEGQLTRWYQAIRRRADGLLLGESVRYNRSGGDAFTFGLQPSGKDCPPNMKDLAQSVFVKEN